MENNFSLIEVLREALDKAGISLVELDAKQAPDYEAKNTVYVPAEHRAFGEPQWKEMRVAAKTLDFYNGDTWNLHIIISEPFDRNDVTNEDLFDRLTLALNTADLHGPGFRLEFKGFKSRGPWGQGHMEMRHVFVTEAFDPRVKEVKKFAVEKTAKKK